MGAAAILIRFTKSRETAYLQHGQLTLERATAISKIRRIAASFSQSSDKAQLSAVRQVESELRTILPHEESRNKKQRMEILQLIELAKPKEHAPSRTPIPTEPDGRTNPTPAGNTGTQLRFAGW
jgi:hypothetical protein